MSGGAGGRAAPTLQGMSQPDAPITPSNSGLAHLRALAACNANVIAPFGLRLNGQRLRLVAEAAASDRLGAQWLIREAGLWRPAMGRRAVSEFELIEPFRLFDPPALVDLLHGLQEIGMLRPPNGHSHRLAAVSVRDLHRQNLILLKALHFDHLVVRGPTLQSVAEIWADLAEHQIERCSLALTGNTPDSLTQLLECLARFRPIRAQLLDVPSFDGHMSAPALTALLMQMQYFRAGPNVVQRFNSVDAPAPDHYLELGPGGGGCFGGYRWRNLDEQRAYVASLQADTVPVEGSGR